VARAQEYTLAVDALIALGRTIPFAFASGINLYATVAVLGLCSRFHIVALPDQFRAFEHPLIISIALAMYVVEFVADKVPWFDSLWDTIHTVVRPIGGALVAVTALGDASPGAQAVAALLGGSVAMTTHLGKAGTRAVANTSPEPFSNWALSLGEDAIAIGLTYFAIQHPLLALAIAVILLVAIVACATVLIRAVRSRFGRRPSQV
jgi:Domain of unknown function (DUF4126)